MLMVVGLLCFLAAVIVWLYLYKKNILHWLPSYLRGLLDVKEKPSGITDVMVLFVDHFELASKPERLKAWLDYPELAKQFKDSDGYHPKHTWFSALDLIDEYELEAIKPMVDAGFGEVELHWHHDHDDEHSFLSKLTEGMRIFHKYGYMKPEKEGVLATYSFIHGNWSLDNSRGEAFCGVDNEISILKQTGCYADFTFPALFSPAQPSTINSIYYTSDDGESASYQRNIRKSQVGVNDSENEFMIFQGPLTINWLDWRHKWHPTFEDGDINCINSHGDQKRIDAWVRQGIHVTGRPEWVFVKIFCHGAQDHKYVLGSQTEEMHRYLTTKYNDGKKYRLHYVSAREAYNIVKAAEDGKAGNPNDFRNYKISHPGER